MITVPLMNDIVYILPLLPISAKRTVLRGNHKINAYYVTCSCVTHRRFIKQYPKRDIRRVCRHLYQLYQESYYDYFDELTRKMLDTQFWFQTRNYFRLTSEIGVIHLMWNDNDKRIFAHIMKNFNCCRFIYEQQQSLWVTDSPDVLCELQIKIALFANSNPCLCSEEV